MPLHVAFHPSTRGRAVALALLCWSGVAPCLAEEKVYSQKPELADSRVRGEAADPAKPTPGLMALGKGPAPTWIWGANTDGHYFLRTTFEGPAGSAWLRASADNKMTVFVNGKKVGQSDNWQEPITADVSSKLKAGTNEVVAEVANDGGASGFALKLALTDAKGGTRYVVSDGSWRAMGFLESKTSDAVTTHGKMGAGPWGDVFAESGLASKAPRDVFDVPVGFKVERLFTVPRDQLGSWVAIAFDDKGRLIASDQDGKGLSRITPGKVGTDEPTKVEHLDIKITAAQGMLHAFGALYFSVNGGPGSGLYRSKEVDGKYGPVEKLATFQGGGEHGPHALRLSPDGKSILAIAGNHTLPPDKIDTSLVPRNWGEDHLLPRQWDANGHARGILAPGGWIARTDPDGKTWEMVSMGYRNPYDFAYNADGELFAYDADMEWDYGMPWYRPTRVSHSPSGSEFGWRSGTGKWPAYYVDSLPATVDVGPGSPVGVTFGYGAKFPAKYQKALFICDWTFGTMYALSFEPSGASYKGTKEEFLSRTPLPLTDVAIGPDGAMYFTIGGRGTQSELFRVTYAGTESIAPADAHDAAFAEVRSIRHKLESFHRKADGAVAFAYPYLGNPDRFLRFAARIALEHQDPATWQDRVLAEKDAETLITGAVALARQGNKALEPKLLTALDRLDFKTLGESKQLELLRAYSLIFIRMGEPDAATASKIAKKLDPFFPSSGDSVNRELAAMLVYLKSPGISRKIVALLERGDETASDVGTELLSRNPGYGGAIVQMQANRPEAQNIHYAFVLRNLKEGWTPDDRRSYFRWLDKARRWTGGASYQGFINNIDKDAYENATDTDRLIVEASGARKPVKIKELPKAKGPGHDWTLDEVLSSAGPKLTGRNFNAGQVAFNAARCVTCHRFAGEGGATGPDLTQAAGRFGVKDMAEAIIEPSKVVSDQYRASVVTTNSGKTLTGRIVGESKDKLTVLVDPEDSTKVVDVPRSDIEEVQPSKVSIMPEKLLSPLNRDEVLDLIAYILSRGDANDPMFKK